MARVAAGRLHLVYVAPERLTFPGFRGLLHDLECPLVAVDEAHCISEWGHDFRPEYLEIGGLLGELPGARVLACTATATPVARDEILARLGLGPDTPQIVRGFARPNLSLRALEVGSDRERQRAVDAALAEALGSPGQGRGTAIVYAPTRKQAEHEGERLLGRGWRARVYHAGLGAAARESAQRDFAEGGAEIVVATNAFGMGIDRPDVRAVIHLGPPGSIEAYYQEVGRAGRDGADALGLLLVSPRDLPLRRALLERGAEGVRPEPAVLEHKWGLFLELIRWVEGGSCRHDAILRYFGDEAETLDGCGRCDVCRALARGRRARGCGDGDLDRAQGALRRGARPRSIRAPDGRQARARRRRSPARARRSHPRADLRQSPRARGRVAARAVPSLRHRGLDQLHRRRATRRRPDGGRPGGHEGRASCPPAPAVLARESGRRSVRGRARRRRRRPPRAASCGRVSPEPDAASGALFEALRRHRLDVAREEGVAPFIVASDRTLRDIARLRPRTLEELAVGLRHRTAEGSAVRAGPAPGGGRRGGGRGEA